MQDKQSLCPNQIDLQNVKACSAYHWNVTVENIEFQRDTLAAKMFSVKNLNNVDLGHQHYYEYGQLLLVTGRCRQYEACENRLHRL